MTSQKPLRLMYPSLVIGYPPKAEALAHKYRETKTQYVIDSSSVELLQNNGVVFGERGEVRFWKCNGRKVGSNVRGWRVE